MRFYVFKSHHQLIISQCWDVLRAKFYSQNVLLWSLHTYIRNETSKQTYYLFPSTFLEFKNSENFSFMCASLCLTKILPSKDAVRYNFISCTQTHTAFSSWATRLFIKKVTWKHHSSRFFPVLLAREKSQTISCRWKFPPGCVQVKMKGGARTRGAFQTCQTWQIKKNGLGG